MTISHSEREHSTWSASATERNWNCPGALTLTDGLPDTTSEAADWGTVCHQVAEKCLNSRADPHSFIGQSVKGKKYSFTFDREMANTTAEYVDYVRAEVEKAVSASVPDRSTYDPRDFLMIEKRFDLSPLNPPFDAGGTADAVVIFRALKEIEIIDLKGGRGVVVDAVGNKPMRMYGLLTMLNVKDIDVDTIKVTIVQPRAPHHDGRIRSETFSVAELLDWANDLMSAMRLSAQAMQVHGGNEMPRAEWADRYLKAGDHCMFCKARSFCPAIEKKALDEAGVWFDDLDKPRLSNRPHEMSPVELARKLDLFDMIDGWMNAVRARALAEAEGGTEIPGYILTEKIGNRTLRADHEEAYISVLSRHGIDPYKHTLLSVAQAEAAGGPEVKEEIAGFFEKPSKGFSLVSANKTSRKAVKAAPVKYFEVIK